MYYYYYSCLYFATHTSFLYRRCTCAWLSHSNLRRKNVSSPSVLAEEKKYLTKRNTQTIQKRETFLFSSLHVVETRCLCVWGCVRKTFESRGCERAREEKTNGNWKETWKPSVKWCLLRGIRCTMLPLSPLVESSTTVYFLPSHRLVGTCVFGWLGGCVYACVRVYWGEIGSGVCADKTQTFGINCIKRHGGSYLFYDYSFGRRLFGLVLCVCVYFIKAAKHSFTETKPSVMGTEYLNNTEKKPTKEETKHEILSPLRRNNWLIRHTQRLTE